MNGLLAYNSSSKIRLSIHFRLSKYALGQSLLIYLQSKHRNPNAILYERNSPGPLSKFDKLLKCRQLGVNEICNGKVVNGCLPFI